MGGITIDLCVRFSFHLDARILIFCQLEPVLKFALIRINIERILFVEPGENYNIYMFVPSSASRMEFDFVDLE